MSISLLNGICHWQRFKRYDKLAFRYVSYVAIPCLAAYSIYSLVYETHRGWYSYTISTLTSFVYMFGFVSTFQRLTKLIYKSALSSRFNSFLSSSSTTSWKWVQHTAKYDLRFNDFLQSVAHMPMKAMIYKTLSTVVDDLFACVLKYLRILSKLEWLLYRFCIKMPILHRLACFRDDVVFLVFLYQVRDRILLWRSSTDRGLYSRGGFIESTPLAWTSMDRYWSQKRRKKLKAKRPSKFHCTIFFTSKEWLCFLPFCTGFTYCKDVEQ